MSPEDYEYYGARIRALSDQAARIVEYMHTDGTPDIGLFAVKVIE